MTEPTLHPIQMPSRYEATGKGRVPSAVTLRAYEVYRELYGEQPALIVGECRGGFGIGELVAFLYAASFPRKEWRARADEAFKGMQFKDRH